MISRRVHAFTNSSWRGGVSEARQFRRVRADNADPCWELAWTRAAVTCVDAPRCYYAPRSSGRYAPDVAGEQLHIQGEDGVHRAKVWLEATTRVTKAWAVYDETAVGRLTFPWPHGGEPYSYDLGGILFGGEFDNQFFLAECKQYKDASDQGTHYDKFLAQSYVTLRDHGRLADHFMWVTWAPFRIGTWSKQSDPDAIRTALLHNNNRERVFGAGTDVSAATAMIDQGIVSDLAERMWIIVLSARQERLVISDEDRGVLLKRRAKKGMV